MLLALETHSFRMHVIRLETNTQAQITSSPEGSQFSIVLAEIVKQDDRPLISGLTHRND